MKDKIIISKDEMNRKMVNSSNPLHVQNFLRGGRIERNKKKYTRKQKHKKVDY